MGDKDESIADITTRRLKHDIEKHEQYEHH
jgi:hypothetical protein